MPPETSSPPVQLVGAGPGAADLLTVRALRAIQGAEALLYDALVCDEVLSLTPANCLKIQTGKRAGRASMRQETINRLMLRLCRRGLRVVRLKGGDPSVFGRVGEEQAFLHANGVATEVVPGVTAACAAAAQFGFPLTHRGEARQLVLSTARLVGGEGRTEWSTGANAQTTLAIYMGRDEIAHVCGRLIDQGRSPATPAAAIENAGRADARCLGATLAELPAILNAAEASGPVLVLVGEVLARSQALDGASADSRRIAV